MLSKSVNGYGQKKENNGGSKKSLIVHVIWLLDKRVLERVERRDALGWIPFQHAVE